MVPYKSVQLLSWHSRLDLRHYWTGFSDSGRATDVGMGRVGKGGVERERGRGRRNWTRE